MRVIREIILPEVKITVFNWNNRYLIKLENGQMEQTFKVNELDITEADVNKILDSEFIKEALIRFNDMAKSFYDARLRNDCL